MIYNIVPIVKKIWSFTISFKRLKKKQIISIKIPPFRLFFYLALTAVMGILYTPASICSQEEIKFYSSHLSSEPLQTSKPGTNSIPLSELDDIYQKMLKKR